MIDGDRSYIRRKMETDYYRKYEPLFGSWYIKDQIGEGSFGKVYVIERKEMGVTYRSALKAITIPQSQSEIKSVMMDGMSKEDVEEYYLKLVHDIVNEFILMAKLKGNSNVVSYEDHILKEHEDGIGWDILIRMELLTPLFDHIAQNQMTRKDILKLGIDMCRAIELCEQNKIIHRDIKPENIFISDNGSFKLGDFGVAKTVEKSNSGLSKKGTYMYMAPEVYRGDPYDLTIDIYSLGIVLYRLLNNNRAPFLPDYPQPIKYTDKEEAMQKRVNGDPIPEPKNGTKEMNRIILKACSFESADRYQTAAEMRRDLEKLSSRITADSEQHQKQENVASVKNENIDGEKSRSKEEKPEHAEKVQVKPSSDDKTKKKRKYSKRIIAAAAAAVLCVVCIVFVMIPKNVTAIEGIGDEETIYIGDTLKPDYKIVPDKFSDSEITFETGDKDVIRVDKEGHIKGRRTGESDLTISARGYQKDVHIKVVAKVTSIKNLKKEITLTEGETKQLKPKLRPAKFKNEKISYKSSNKKVARVSKKGKITAKSPGKAKITVSAGGYSRTITVGVKKYVAPTAAPATTYTPTQSYNYYNSGGSSDGTSKNKDASDFSVDDFDYEY